VTTPTDDGALIAASRREEALYAGLVAVYQELAAALADPATRTDPAWIGERHARAGAATDELRVLAAALGPRRLSPAPVPPAARAHWSRSAELAAEAARLGADLIALARGRQSALASQLGEAASRRVALEAYRPTSVAERPRLTA
jgi:hypothetical protein